MNPRSNSLLRLSTVPVTLSPALLSHPKLFIKVRAN